MATKRLARCGLRSARRGFWRRRVCVPPGRGGLPRPGAEPAPSRRHAGRWGWRGAAGAARGAAERRRPRGRASAFCSSSTSSPRAGGTRGSAAPRSVSAAAARPGAAGLGACAVRVRVRPGAVFERALWRPALSLCSAPVEFPAVLLNADTGRVEAEFHSFVQPQEQPLLSGFCTALTGVTQFLRWLRKVQNEKKFLFSSDMPNNTVPEAKLCAFVTWTDWDLGVCLHYECKRKQLWKPDIFNSWIDLKATYRAFYNRKPKGLSGALQDLGLAFVGREHSEQATSSGCSADMHVVSGSSSRTDLCEEIRSYSTVSADRFTLLGHAQQSHSTLSPGIQQGLNHGQLVSTARYSSPVCGSGLVLISTTISSVNTSSEDTGTHSDCLSLLTDWEDVALIPKSQSEPNSDCVQLEKDSSTDILMLSEEKTTPEQSTAMSPGDQSLGKTLVPIEPPKSIVYKSPDTTIYNVGMVQRQPSNRSTFKIPSAEVNAISSQSVITRNFSVPSEVPKRKPTSPTALPPAKKHSFSIYQEKMASSDHALSLRNLNLSKASRTVLSSTVNLNQSVTAVQNEKLTPPLCKCGRRAKRLYVSNAGPNHGKAFFCCPVGRREGSKRSCGYFKWENAILKEKSHVATMNVDALNPLGTCLSTSGNSSNKHLFLRPSMRT
ncbi:hypothetical protein ASZ78_015993 [Callipepla squamata]|uniref:GRF-type domain-containing protein n=1 Tax=Callipepla squamata TaxID=9009 RepID=A0A226MU07_CALSU|nr:hypothetical protein ASZ78_015993 [Callipepla squamata]